jgi:molybdopterin-guanine dinucleotide biosynthesis protein A
MDARKAVILLVGGLSSRLGSDKALQPVAGKPMIRHIIEGVSGLSDEFLVVVARNASGSEYSGILPDFIRVIKDEPEGKNPLIGIVSGLRAIRSPYAIVLSCDIPFVDRRVIQLLLKQASGADAVIPRWNAGHLEPLQAVYCREPTLDAAEEALAKGHTSPTDMISKLARVVFISIEDQIRLIDPELRTFFNVNTKQDLARAEWIFRQRRTRGGP